MIAFIDTHRDQFGVELICRVLRPAITGFLTSRGYRAAKTRPACDREIRDEQLIAVLRTVHRDNYSCYGVLKMHRAMTRRGHQIGREQTRRVIYKAGLCGCSGASRCSPRSPIRLTCSRQIWSTVSSRPPHRTGCGSLTLCAARRCLTEWR